MADYGSIQLEGLDKVLREFRKLTPETRKAAMQGLQAGGLDIIAEAQKNLRSNGSVVTGLLRQSGKVEKVDDDTLDVGFFDSQNHGHGYAFYVENGRRSGKMPPPDELIQYCYKKLRMSLEEARAAGWAKAKSIAKYGTKPHPFFGPAVEAKKKTILQRMEDAIKKKTR